ncbi:hypothetical protein DOY81_010239 [Sarcophaga bullata]|nr:hypothetical protein DOY81_010239 [Sarcophaga bullata]
MIESNKCKYLAREPVYGACTVAKCEEEELKIPHQHQRQHHHPQQHHHNAAATNSNTNDYNDSDNDNDNDNDMKQLQNDDSHYSNGNGMDHIDEKFRGIHGVSSKTVRDLVAGKEKLVIAAAPQSLKNCSDELNNCKRINRERLCKLEFYRTYCCLTCHGYY